MQTILGPLARVLITILWAVGDWLFDWFVTVPRAEAWRAAAARKIQAKIERNAAWRPTTDLAWTWKENRRSMLRAECAFMGFATAVYDAEQTAHGQN
jgi:hypothetical protein